MQNVYDLAHELARSLKETDQYKDYAAAKKKIDANADLAKMIEDFQQKSMEIQSAQMMGQEPNPEAVAQFQQMYGIVLSDPLAAEYMQKQMSLSQIVTELYGILGEALKFE
ncbi:MAG: YlbF family regulator [Clostridia bacterium]|nr:YlbF family regulator [Clostridia bacterium]